MLIAELDQYFRNLLELDRFERADSSLNGLQLGLAEGEVRKIAFAVDACMASFERAAEAGAELLFVHHGLFWGRPLSVTAGHYHRVKYLMDHSLALYAVHLPLDAHPRFGNNAGIADQLDLRDREPWGAYKGLDIGFRGRLPQKLGLDDVLGKLELRREECAGFLSFGPEYVETVGIISGDAPYEVREAIKDGLDLYITGETAHEIYHACAEAEINMIAGGHYHTETVGVRLLSQQVQADTGLETTFIDVPTGL